MRWQGSVNTPWELAHIVPLSRVQELDGIFYTCKSNNGIYILNAASTAEPIDGVIIQVESATVSFSTPGRFVKVNDIFVNVNSASPLASDTPAEIPTGFFRSTTNGVFLKVGGQMIQVGQWPV